MARSVLLPNIEVRYADYKCVQDDAEEVEGVSSSDLSEFEGVGSVASLAPVRASSSSSSSGESGGRMFSRHIDEEMERDGVGLRQAARRAEAVCQGTEYGFAMQDYKTMLKEIDHLATQMDIQRKKISVVCVE